MRPANPARHIDSCDLCRCPGVGFTFTVLAAREEVARADLVNPTRSLMEEREVSVCLTCLRDAAEQRRAALDELIEFGGGE
jgi:hypothetical protein